MMTQSRVSPLAKRLSAEDALHERAVKRAIDQIGSRRVVEIVSAYAAERHAGACNADSKRVWRLVWNRLAKALDAMK